MVSFEFAMMLGPAGQAVDAVPGMQEDGSQVEQGQAAASQEIEVRSKSLE